MHVLIQCQRHDDAMMIDEDYFRQAARIWSSEMIVRAASA